MASAMASRSVVRRSPLQINPTFRAAGANISGSFARASKEHREERWYNSSVSPCGNHVASFKRTDRNARDCQAQLEICPQIWGHGAPPPPIVVCMFACCYTHAHTPPMPELPEVETSRLYVEKFCVGSTITKVHATEQGGGPVREQIARKKKK